MTRGHDHGHLLEGTCVTEAGEQEHEQHERYEDVEISPALGVVENPRNTAEGDGHTNARDEGPDCTTHAVAEGTPRHTDKRTDERAEEGEGRAQDGQADRGGTTELVVNEQAEDCRESGEQTEGHDVENGHVPGVRVREDIQLLLDVGLDRNITQVDEGKDRGDDAPRDEEDCGVVHPDLLAGVLADLSLGSQPRHTEKTKSHESRADQLDDGHTEVTDAALQAQSCTRKALGEEVAGGGHVAGERAAADATHEGQGQQDPVGGCVVLDNVEPTQHGDHEEQRGDAHHLARTDHRGQEHVDQTQKACGQAGQCGQPVELRSAEVESKKRQLRRDCAWQEPHTEAQNERVCGDGQRPPRKLRIPLFGVIRLPILKDIFTGLFFRGRG